MIDWDKEFPLVSISRADLHEAGVSDAHIQTLTDTDMQEIASMMADIYLDNGYWEDLQLWMVSLLTVERESERKVLTERGSEQWKR